MKKISYKIFSHLIFGGKKNNKNYIYPKKLIRIIGIYNQHLSKNLYKTVF